MCIFCFYLVDFLIFLYYPAALKATVVDEGGQFEAECNSSSSAELDSCNLWCFRPSGFSELHSIISNSYRQVTTRGRTRSILWIANAQESHTGEYFCDKKLTFKLKVVRGGKFCFSIIFQSLVDNKSFIQKFMGKNKILYRKGFALKRINIMLVGMESCIRTVVGRLLRRTGVLKKTGVF